MSCPVCETLPVPCDGPSDLYLWAPLAHSAGRILGQITDPVAPVAPPDPAGIPAGTWAGTPASRPVFAADPVNGALVARGVEPAGLSRILAALAGLLTSLEAEDTRALVVPAGRQPTPADIPRAQPLSRLIARDGSRWLIDLLGQGRLVSYYHAIVSAADPGQIFAREALVRGVTPDGRVIGGGAIMEAARAAGLLFQTDLAARTAAVEGFARARPGGRLFVNFSPTAIYDPTYCLRSTFARMEHLDLTPGDIVFEVVESERHEDLGHLRRILETYRAKGFGVALDDFGAGYSTYEVLHALAPDFVKLDMSLVRGSPDDPRKKAVLEGAIALCQRLSVPVIAEGIETEAEEAVVRAAGADYLQGFRFARPDPL